LFSFVFQPGVPKPQASTGGPQASVSDGRKSKKDKVDQKLGRRESDQGPSTPVTAVQMTKMTAAQGSAVSLRSNVSRTSKGLNILCYILFCTKCPFSQRGNKNCICFYQHTSCNFGTQFRFWLYMQSFEKLSCSSSNEFKKSFCLLQRRGLKEVKMMSKVR